MAQAESRQNLVRRLKRIEGQVRGIQRMGEQDRACGDILAQLSAVNEAVRRVSILLAEEYAYECLGPAQASDQDAAKSRETIATLIDTLMKGPK